MIGKSAYVVGGTQNYLGTLDARFRVGMTQKG